MSKINDILNKIQSVNEADNGKYIKSELDDEKNITFNISLPVKVEIKSINNIYEKGNTKQVRIEYDENEMTKTIKELMVKEIAKQVPKEYAKIVTINYHGGSSLFRFPNNFSE